MCIVIPSLEDGIKKNLEQNFIIIGVVYNLSPHTDEEDGRYQLAFTHYDGYGNLIDHSVYSVKKEPGIE